MPLPKSLPVADGSVYAYLDRIGLTPVRRAALTIWIEEQGIRLADSPHHANIILVSKYDEHATAAYMEVAAGKGDVIVADDVDFESGVHPFWRRLDEGAKANSRAALVEHDEVSYEGSVGPLIVRITTKSRGHPQYADLQEAARPEAAHPDPSEIEMQVDSEAEESDASSRHTASLVPSSTSWVPGSPARTAPRSVRTRSSAVPNTPSTTARSRASAAQEDEAGERSGQGGGGKATTPAKTRAKVNGTANAPATSAKRSPVSPYTDVDFEMMVRFIASHPVTDSFGTRYWRDFAKQHPGRTLESWRSIAFRKKEALLAAALAKTAAARPETERAA